jgi:hypothetical protein
VTVAVRRRNSVARAEWPDHPPPCWVYEFGSFAHPLPGEVETVWVARVAGSVVGGCLLNLPMLDNQHNARSEILIVGYATSRWFAGQEDTIVVPEPRGHRLGTLVKVANLDLARAQRPELRVIDTCNADSNPYMVRINEAMGFRPHHRAGEWQLDV